MTTNEKMTTDEHIKWCKERAKREFKFYKDESLQRAIREGTLSIISDLRKHPETADMSLLYFELSKKVYNESEFYKFVESIKHIKCL